MPEHRCDRLRAGQVCKPHLRIPIWKRLLFSAAGVLVVVWWPVANRVKAGAGIQEVQSFIFGTGILFLVVGVASCAMAAAMHEDHETKYFLSGAGLPAALIGLVYLPQVLG
jgi:hypothetical protein